jgi:hypothetical protein
MGMTRYTELNSYNQAASIDLSRSLSEKWTVSLSGAGQDTTLAQFMFQPSNLSLLANSSSSFDDLAAAFSVGQFSNSQVATMLTGSAILDTPTRNLLLGNRVLSVSLQASIAYTHSSRLSFRFASFAAGAQRVKGIDTGLLPSSKGINGGVAMSYSLSPRTQIGASADISHIYNSFQRSNVVSTMGSWGRKMGPRWFLRAGAGGAYNKSHGQPSTLQAIGEAAIGFWTFNHTFVASANRSATDPFGIAAAENTLIGGTWSWHPATSWTVSSGFGYQRLKSVVFQELTGWRTGIGVSKSIGSGMTVTADYSYMNGTSLFLSTLADRSIHSARLSLSWSPMLGQQ